MEEPIIKLKMNISRQTMEDVFVTALEGGSNYWYYISQTAIDKVRAVVPKTEEGPLSVALFKAVFDHDVEVPVNDYENKKVILGVLSKKNIQTRLQKMIDDGYADILMDEEAGDGDANSSDTIFQYMTMGSIVFG